MHQNVKWRFTGLDDCCIISVKTTVQALREHNESMVRYMKLPELIKVRQSFDSSCIENVGEMVLMELQKLDLKLPAGSKIAITAGSRGIDRIPQVIKTVVDYVRQKGCEPFIVPAMGSHGGATAEGQVKVLEELGITAESVGARIAATMETVIVGSIDVSSCSDKTGEQLDVHMDRNAWNADGIIVINRVKPHTSFHATIESGILKMMVIGLGKEVQARNVHSYGTKGLRKLLEPAARVILATGKVIAAVGILENAHDKISEIKAFPSYSIEQGEAVLLEKARMNMPGLPLNKLDVLIIEEIGKNISGTGMDTNIVGRLRIEGENEPENPKIKRIVVLGLSHGTNGNAYGMGLADFTTRKLADSINYESTYANVIATTFLERAKIPVIAETEEEAISLALQTSGVEDFSRAKVIRIKNTLQLEKIEVSQSVLDEIRDRITVL